MWFDTKLHVRTSVVFNHMSSSSEQWYSQSVIQCNILLCKLAIQGKTYKQNFHTSMELYPSSTMKIQWRPTPLVLGQRVLFELGQPTFAYHSLYMQCSKVTPSTECCACLAAFKLLLALHETKRQKVRSWSGSNVSSWVLLALAYMHYSSIHASAHITSD